MDTIWVALIVASSTTISPLLLAALTGRQRRRDREVDYARQDAVAKKAAEAVQAMLNAATDTNEKLDVIHVLVNSTLTAAMRSELEAISQVLTTLQENIALSRAAGKEPDEQRMIQVKTVSDRIVELRAVLTDRAAQQAKVEAMK